MPDDRSDDERQRDYEQIKQDLMRRGRGIAEAEVIAARTVSPERAQALPTNEQPSESVETADASPLERSYRELYAEAKSRGIAGRSTMSRAELERQLAS